MTTVSDDAVRIAVAQRRALHRQEYLRDTARALDLTEAHVVNVHPAADVVRLTDDWPLLMHVIAQLGRVKTMTRNEHAVIEKDGCVEGVEFFGPSMGQAVGKDIDLRLFTQQWGSAFGVFEETPGAVRRSIQIFDRHGASVFKVYSDDALAFEQAVTRCAAGSDTPLLIRAADPVVERPDADVDVDALHARWDAMTNTHEFHGLLRSLNVTRTQALRLAGTERATPLDNGALECALHTLAEAGERLMLFVGNRGIIQIYSGMIHRVVRANGWLNVLDPGFNLHARDDAITQSWLVTKPTADGPVRSLELFDAAGETVALLFGKRSEGETGTPPGFAQMLQGLVRAGL